VSSLLSVGQGFSLRRVATLPSALFDKRFSLGASWVFSLQSVLPPVCRPSVPFLGMKVGPGDQRSHRFFLRMFLTYAAVGIGHPPLFRNGSYTSLLTYKRCSNIANLHAVALMAFLPVCATTLASFKPQRRRLLSAPNCPRMCCARSTSRVRRWRPPSTDVHLRLALPRVSPPRLQPQLRRFSCWRTC
jgi:hypothetical protein